MSANFVIMPPLFDYTEDLPIVEVMRCIPAYTSGDGIYYTCRTDPRPWHVTIFFPRGFSLDWQATTIRLRPRSIFRVCTSFTTRKAAQDERRRLQKFLRLFLKVHPAHCRSSLCVRLLNLSRIRQDHGR